MRIVDGARNIKALSQWLSNIVSGGLVGIKELREELFNFLFGSLWRVCRMNEYCVPAHDKASPRTRAVERVFGVGFRELGSQALWLQTGLGDVSWANNLSPSLNSVGTFYYDSFDGTGAHVVH